MGQNWRHKLGNKISNSPITSIIFVSCLFALVKKKHKSILSKSWFLWDRYMCVCVCITYVYMFIFVCVYQIKFYLGCSTCRNYWFAILPEPFLSQWKVNLITRNHRVLILNYNQSYLYIWYSLLRFSSMLAFYLHFNFYDLILDVTLLYGERYVEVGNSWWFSQCCPVSDRSWILQASDDNWYLILSSKSLFASMSRRIFLIFYLNSKK